jgi:hypothetical protein
MSASKLSIGKRFTFEGKTLEIVYDNMEGGGFCTGCPYSGKDGEDNGCNDVVAARKKAGLGDCAGYVQDKFTKLKVVEQLKEEDNVACVSKIEFPKTQAQTVVGLECGKLTLVVGDADYNRGDHYVAILASKDVIYFGEDDVISYSSYDFFKSGNFKVIRQLEDGESLTVIV